MGFLPNGRFKNLIVCFFRMGMGWKGGIGGAGGRHLLTGTDTKTDVCEKQNSKKSLDQIQDDLHEQRKCPNLQ